MDLQTLYKQHPVAVVGIVGGVALAGAYTLSKRGAKAATYPVAPITGSGSGIGYGFGTGPEPNRDPCSTPLGFLNPGCNPAPPDGDPCGGVGGFLNPNCNPSPTPDPPEICVIGYHHDEQGHCIPDAPPPICGPGPLQRPCDPGPPPGPNGGHIPIIPAGISSGDYSYMKAFDTSKRDMQMRISPW